jgi:hypothetical protein
MTRTLPVVVCLCFGLAACRKTEDVPAYLVIPAIGVDATMAEGGSTSKITEAWVSLNNSSLGVWELPARIPALGTGTNTVTVTAGVKRNGTFDDRLRYPFYESWSSTVELVEEASVDLAPTVVYADEANFWWEGFEDVGNKFNVSEESDTTLILYTPNSDPDVLVDGSTCAGFVLEPGRSRMSMYTDEDFSASSGPAFVELDYSTDVTLTIGLLYNSSGVNVAEAWVVLVPTTDPGGLRWNKVYIDVSAFFEPSGVSQRDFYIATALPSGQSSGRVLLDNFKLVRRDP